MLDPHREIQALIDNFVADVGDLARRIARAQLDTAFGGVGALLASSRAPAAIVAASRGGRARRDPSELGALRERLLAAIAEQPGRRTEELNAALGTQTPQIAALLRQLVAEHQVRTEGNRRGTRYFASGPAEPVHGRRARGGRAPTLPPPTRAGTTDAGGPREELGAAREDVPAAARDGGRAGNAEPRTTGAPPRSADLLA